MSSTYYITIKASHLERSEQIAEYVLAAGATDAYEVEWDGETDRWEFEYPDLNDINWILNLRVDGEFTEGWEHDHGCDFELLIDVQFRNDTPETRAVAEALTQRLAENLEVQLVYNSETVLWKNDAPGTPLSRPPDYEDPGYVADLYRTQMDRHNHVLGFRAEDIGF